MKKPRRLIQYILSADPRLQRISLKKLSARMKNMKRGLKRSSVRSNHARHTTRSKKPARTVGAMSVPAIVLLVICVAAAAVLIAARQPASRADVATMVTATPDVARSEAQVSALPAASPIETETAAPSKPAARSKVKVTEEKTATSARPVIEKAEAPKPLPAPAAIKMQGPDATTGKLPAAGSMSARVMEPTTPAPAVESATKTDDQGPPSVTITGCLEVDDGTVWLKNTSGSDVPKSRSWKSAFLRKRSSPIEIVDAPNAPRLTHYVGQRVAATGVLTNREMRASSLRIVAACE